LIWTGVYAFLSYQNLGTAVRFKAQILPVLFLLYATVGIAPHEPADQGTPAAPGAVR
jgi:hypothetical protein